MLAYVSNFEVELSGGQKVQAVSMWPGGNSQSRKIITNANRIAEAVRFAEEHGELLVVGENSRGWEVSIEAIEF